MPYPDRIPMFEWLSSYLLLLSILGVQPLVAEPVSPTVAETLTQATAPDGHYISWIEHLIDGPDRSDGAPIVGGDGLALYDIDQDGFMDVVSVHEDSHHLRIAFGSEDPDRWENVTIAQGALVGAIEDVAVGDLNEDGWPDIVAACEDAHLAYFENPGSNARSERWSSLIPEVTQNRGSWLQVAIADMNSDGVNEVVAANKGFDDIVRLKAGERPELPTSMFRIEGDPLTQAAWRELVLLSKGIPNQAITFDVDADGDLDVLAAARLRNQMFIVENLGSEPDGSIRSVSHQIIIDPSFETPLGWKALSNAFNAVFADINQDGRVDLLVNVMEFDAEHGRAWSRAELGWLAQPEHLSDPWTYHRIGNTLPDWIIGVAAADIDGDGDVDAITGGYSGLNIIAGSYSGESRDYDDPAVTTASSVARIAWFENPGVENQAWLRHDIARRVRGMYDDFIARDMDADGDLDLVSTRGNSGEYDGVFWLEQVRSKAPRPSFTAARANESKHLPLPPVDWRDNYGQRAEYEAPNKAAQKSALHQ